MGQLANEDTGQIIPLRARHLIGRSSRCDLQIPVPVVSGEHATLWWEGSHWCIKDLGSRNGTVIDGALLRPGEGRSLLEGAVIVFGAPKERWVLRSATPPLAQAVSEEDRSVCLATGELLAIPGPETPLVTVYRAPRGNWVLEDGDNEQPARDGEVVSVDGRDWRLHLPEPNTGTLDLDAQVRTLTTITLRMAHSLDEEHVEVSIGHNHQWAQLKTRAHHYLLLTLARQRVSDAADASLSPSAHGWVYQDELLRMLGTDKNKLNVDIFRARKQFADAGVEGAANIVERRASTRQLRIGVGALDIQRL